jgi:Tfp pilus assembly protein PilW
MFKTLKAKLKSAYTLQSTNYSGYSMLEMLLASAVGVIVILGSYTSFVIVAKQYQRISAFSETYESGAPTINLIKRDLRMAGRVAMDANMDPVFGTIATPITITDSGNACCDSIVIVYDRTSGTSNQRCQITYSIAARTNPTRNAIYMQVSTLNASPGAFTCTGAGGNSLVADYVDDLQFVGSDNDSNGNPMIIDMSLIIHSKGTIAKTITYTRPAQIVGNYNFTATDNHNRDEFTATVNIKNLR